MVTSGRSVRVGIVVFFLSLLSACSGPELKPWHTVHLDGEFTASKAQDVNTLSAYLKQEAIVFQQLEDDVVTDVETGPKFALQRYSAGSAANPSGFEINWNRTFTRVPESPRGGVLLLHGMSDSPYSLRELGERLYEAGYLVVGLRYPGHGTAPSGLLRVRWEDMRAAVRLAMDHLGNQLGDRPVHIIGYSTGAPLAIEYALDAEEQLVETPVASLVLVSPAIGIHGAAAFASWKRGMSGLPGFRGLAWLQVQPEFDPFKYNSFSANAADQVHRMTRAVARRIAARAPEESLLPPILVFKSTVDATVTNAAVVDNFLKQLSSKRHELVLFDTNRAAIKSELIVADPGPFTREIMDDSELPFAVTLVSNSDIETRDVSLFRKPAFSSEAGEPLPLGLAWPPGVISLSHVALPFPADDPLYGRRPPGNTDAIYLGELAIKGERGLFLLSPDWLLRLRHNPFYEYLEKRSIDWINRQP